MTPNIGQGGNNAIESAAALTNSLEMLLRSSTSTKPSYKSIKNALEAFQRHREIRTKGILTAANKITRIDALKGPIEELMALYIAPNAGEIFANRIGDAMIGSEKLEFLPDPERSLTATMAYNQNYGVGHEESTLRRAVTALPLLVLAYVCHSGMESIISRICPHIESSLTTGKLDIGAAQTIDLSVSYYGGISWLENALRPIVILFSPSLLNVDPIQRLQTMSFFADLAPLYLIWILESHRRANTFTFARFVLVFGVAFQMFGIGRVAPLFYFLHYIQSPLSQFTAFDQRLINVAATHTAVSAVIIAYLIPTVAMFSVPDFAARLHINAVWQLFPVLVSAIHYLLRRFVVTDTTPQDRIHNPSADLPAMRIAVKALVIVSVLTFNWIRLTSPYSLSTIFLPSAKYLSTPTEELNALDLVSGMALFLKVDYLACFAASFVWLTLLFKDLKEVDMVAQSWGRLVLYLLAGTYVAGPGAVLGMAWLWREEVLATKRARGAVVRKS